MIDDTPRPRGRPRAFDRDHALACAQLTFWKLGYEGASVADLTAAMAITPQSLYSAFSSKADLFRESLDRYLTHEGAALTAPLADTHAIVALARMLRQAASLLTAPEHPPGCMLSAALPAAAVENEAVMHHVSALRNARMERLHTRIEQGISVGQISPETDAVALARFIAAMLDGMSLQARDGASASDLKSLAEHAVSEIARHRA